jgi:transcriptional regulator with XRE-family HTH domain
MEYFLENELLQPEQRSPEKMDPKLIIGLRQRMVGALLRKARIERGLTLEQIAESTGISADQLERYEFGQQGIPVPELDAIAEQLGSTAKAFQDRNGPIATGSWNNALRFLSFSRTENVRFRSGQRPYWNWLSD